MGAGQSIQTNLWNSTLQFQSKNNKLGIIRLSHKQTEDPYICRKLSIIDKKLIQQIDRLVDIKLSIQSPYVAKLQKATTQKNQQYCAYGKNYYLLFKQPYQTLKQQTLNRKFKNSLYSQNQLQIMLEVGVKGLWFLKNIGHPHENISSTAFFINQNRSMILGDPFMFSRENQPQKVINGFTYPSPQLIKYQNHEIEDYNKHLSDLFTFGLVLLEVFQMANMDCVYEKYFERVNFEIINKKLSGLKNQQLRKKLFILLNPQAKNREIIFKYFIKSITTMDIYNKLSRQKFKKTIDRYNLATSEVTEWKNDPTLENRLQSSDGKKTFSVSTNQNPSNQQKIQSLPNQPTLQNQGFNQIPKIKKSNITKYESQEQQGLANKHRNKNLFNKKDPNQLYKNHVPSFQKTLSSLQTAYPPYQYYQQPFLSGYQDFYQINSNQNSYKLFQKKNFQIPSPVFNHQTFPLTLSYSPQQGYNLLEKIHHVPDFKIVQQPTNKYFQVNDTLNTFQEILSNKPSVPSQIFKSNVSNQTPQTTNQNLNDNREEQTQQKSFKQTSYNLVYTLNKNEIQNIYNHDKIHQNQNEFNGNTNKAFQNESLAKNKTTPVQQKGKRSSLEYCKFHQLSTINQRSQLTQSFISETHEKKSDILIQQDQQNVETLRDCQSQKQKVDHSSIQQNKVWSITYPSGTKYVGEIKNDKRNGLGTFFYIDGSKYHGHWSDNKMNGFGTLYYPNGKIAYEGEWKLDNFHGKGKVYNDQIEIFTSNYHYEDCSDIDNYWLEYDGQLFEDRKEGKGTLKLANGEYFQAQFKNDELHGQCKFYSRQNKMIEGFWQSNKLVKVVFQKQNL